MGAVDLGTEIFNNAQVYASRSYAAAIGIINDLGVMPDISYPSSNISVIITLPPNLPVQVLPPDPVISSYLDTEAPLAPDLTPQTYTDDFLIVVRQWFTDRINSGGTGIVQQSAIYGFENDRNSQLLSDARTRILTNNSPWVYPNGCLTAAISRFEFDNINTGLDVSRERRMNEEKNAIDQLEFAISAGVELEKALIMYGPEMAKTLAYMFSEEVSAYDASVSGQIASITAIVEEYNALIGAYEAQTNVNEAAARNYGKLVNVEAKAAGKQAALIVTGVEAQIKAAITLVKNQTETILDLAKSGMAMCGGAMAAATANANLSSSGLSSYVVRQHSGQERSTSTSTNNITNNRS